MNSITSTAVSIDNIVKTYGKKTVVNNVSFTVEKGEIFGLIGPNGAGKTTVFNLITGVYKPDSGNIVFNEQNIAGLAPYTICGKGISRTFQNIRLFNDLSVLDNVKIAAHKDVPYGIFSSILRTPRFFAGEEKMEQDALRHLEIFQLAAKRDELARNLPYGEQRRLEIARAMATNPTLLILDEPAAGMNPQETKDLMNLIQSIRENFNLTILLIEHDMSLVMGVCERIYVLDYGQIIAEGLPEEIRSNRQVIEAYLGEEVE